MADRNPRCQCEYAMPAALCDFACFERRNDVAPAPPAEDPQDQRMADLFLEEGTS